MAKDNKFICIHGHFYQPPRENAWLETIEKQDSAAPFHDWNERINYECYAPNTAARILDKDSNIININNNYAQISFNFGPTLLSWMQKEDPDAYEAIIRADKHSTASFNGAGSGIAQVYNHIIMPLANQRDKDTQIIWGIKEFASRFNRQPKGMWLAETAADTATLEALVKQGIQYTILAPRQAKAFKKIGESTWNYLEHSGIDPRRPYRCFLPSGKHIDLFFYDGNVAQDVAFRGLLNDGKGFAKRLLDIFDDDDIPQIVHIATDGESYGHHHNHGEMALADCLNHIKESGIAKLTNYSEYLDKFPPRYEAQIHENSSWSCVHGVERWRSNCGCNTGGHPSWSQNWRKPLRELLDWLRDQLIPIYEEEAAKYLNNPWEARDNYIAIILDRKLDNIHRFIQQNAKRQLEEAEITHVLRLMEMQRNALLMFTSCAWFFDEISGIEVDQVLQYALRAISYANQVSGKNLHPEFERKLEQVPSNVHENGAVSYKKNVRPTRLTLERVGMHYAIASLFEENPDNLSLFNYKAFNHAFEKEVAGNYRLVIGRTTVQSRITLSKKDFSFAVLYLGQQNIIGNLSTTMSIEEFQEMQTVLRRQFKSTDLGRVIGSMQSFFDSEKFSIWHLFRDEKRKILKQVTDKSLKQIEHGFREIFDDNYQLMSGMVASDIPLPDAYKSAINHIVNTDLQNFFDQEILKVSDLKHLANEITKWKLDITDAQGLRFSAGERVFYEIRKIDYLAIPKEQIQMLVDIIDIFNELNLELDIWKSQNYFFLLLKDFLSGKRTFPNEEWKAVFLNLGRLLHVRVDPLESVSILS